MPAGGGFFEDGGEAAGGVAAAFAGAGEVVFAGGEGEGFAEGADFDVFLLEVAEGVAVGEVGAEGGTDGGEAADGAAEDGLGVGRVFIEGEVGVEVAAVPGGLLGEEGLGDVELKAGGGEELVRLLGARECGQGAEAEGEDEDSAMHWASFLKVIRV